MSIPHPIPCQGSKRGLARAILRYFPAGVECLIEPFAGSAAISLAAAFYGKAGKFILGDLNQALIHLWEDILNRPEDLSQAYERLWLTQQGHERAFYDEIRTRFNQTQQTDCFLYLLARCVKASVRYNANGEFNQSPDNRRKGAHPATMRTHILGASRLLKDKTCLQCADYKEIVGLASPRDLIYMDPPYQGVCGNRDPRYFGDIAFYEFVDVLGHLNSRGINYLVSYDGRSGHKAYGQPLPQTLELKHIEIDAGRSTQATLLGRCDRTVESLYLSPALVAHLDDMPAYLLYHDPVQLSLFDGIDRPVGMCYS